MSSEIKSNISLYYEDFVASLAETARLKLSESEGEYEDEAQAVSDAICEQFIFHVDRAYVLAHAYIEGYVEWCGEVDWESLDAMLYDDVHDELRYMLRQQEDDEEDDD